MRDLYRIVQRDESLLLRKDIGDLNRIYITNGEQMVGDVTCSRFAESVY